MIEIILPLLCMVIRMEDFSEPRAGPNNLRDIGMDVLEKCHIRVTSGVIIKHRFLIMRGVVVMRRVIGSVVGGGVLSGRGDRIEQFEPSRA